jgi:3-oxoacyl-(acyl-carrier-protein) synthase
MTRRVVVTGMGVVAPNGIGVAAFEAALRAGHSGVRAIPKLRELGFGCQVAGVPDGADERAAATFDPDELLAMNSNHRFACLAALEAWEDAGLRRPAREDDTVDWATGAVLGTGIGGMDTPSRQHDGRAGDGERHLGTRGRHAGARQPGHDELQRVQHRDRGRRRGPGAHP